MPELPEVETTLRAILPLLKGNKILAIEVLRPNMTLHKPDSLQMIRNQEILTIIRRGKYLLMHFENDHTMILHLKMSGRLGLRSLTDTPLTYERIRFHLPKDQLLIFNDPRTLGRAYVIETKDIETHSPLAKMGPDALSVSEEVFLTRAKKKRGVLKAVLLDQAFLAGIGNIYADEACFVAKIDPRRRIENLNQAELKRLHIGIIKTLEKGIENKGTSFSDFSNLFGKPGKNQQSLFVYGRAGNPCLVCKSSLQKTTIGQRTTVWCGACQR